VALILQFCAVSKKSAFTIPIKKRKKKNGADKKMERNKKEKYELQDVEVLSPKYVGEFFVVPLLFSIMGG